MARKNLKSALTTSLQAENAAVKDRFEKAESLLSDKPRPIDPIDTPHQELQKQDIADIATPEKVIRDTFTMPSTDYDLIAAIQHRCLQSALNVTRSEIVRAGLKILNELSDENLMQAMQAVEKIKSGRPSRKKQ